MGDRTIYDLHADHEYATRLLDQLEAQIEIYHGGGVPDFDLIREVLDSTLSFASLHHRLSEDRTLSAIRKEGGARPSAKALFREHVRGKKLSRSFAAVVKNVASDVEMPRSLFDDLARRYLDFNRRYLAKEKAVFLSPTE